MAGDVDSPIAVVSLAAGVLAVATANPPGVLLLRQGAESAPHPTTDLKSFARAGLAALDADARAGVMATLVKVLEWDLSPAQRAEASDSLMALRDALRERFPYCPTTESAARALRIKSLVRLDDSSFFLHGWMHDRESPVVSLTAVSPEGLRAELMPQVCSPADTRIDLAGTFELPGPSIRADGWRFEVRNEAGLGHEVKGPRVTRDARDGIRSVIELLPARGTAGAFECHHLAAAVARLQKRLRDGVMVEGARQYGNPPVSPAMSVVIALDETFDPVEHQLAQFVRDPEVRRVDLIYVAAPCAGSDRWEERADGLFDLYRVPFRLLTLDRPASLAAAIDAAQAHARGELMVMLDPDVLPAAPGWVGRLERLYRSQTGIGTVDVELTHADNSVRTGMAAGCVLIARDLLERLGGLSGSYLERDAETADLCARAIAAGREHRRCEGIGFEHLGERRVTRPETLYDEWLRLTRASPHASTAEAAHPPAGSAT